PGLWSRDPVSTAIRRSGRRVCAAIAARLRGRYSAPSWQTSTAVTKGRTGTAGRGRPARSGQGGGAGGAAGAAGESARASVPRSVRWLRSRLRSRLTGTGPPAGSDRVLLHAPPLPLGQAT